jgi:hypothetical protein
MSEPYKEEINNWSTPPTLTKLSPFAVTGIVDSMAPGLIICFTVQLATTRTVAVAATRMARSSRCCFVRLVRGYRGI